MRFRQHPVLGDLDLDFTDDLGSPFPTVIFAGGNGCGKTVLLETIHRIFEWNPSPAVGNFDIEIILDANNLEQLRLSKLVDVAHAIKSLVISYKGEYRNNADWKFYFRGQKTDETTASDYSIVSNPVGKKLFRCFLTEANVSFNAGRITSVTTLA